MIHHRVGRARGEAPGGGLGFPEAPRHAAAPHLADRGGGPSRALLGFGLPAVRGRGGRAREGRKRGRRLRWAARRGMVRWALSSCAFLGVAD